MKKVMLTGARPTGKLHIGHFVGSILPRLEMEKSDNYDEMFLMIADAQALTDNFEDVNKVKNNVFEISLDFLATGMDVNKVNLFVQSEISELTELTFYYMNLVTLSRLMRNPTVKEEMKQKNFEATIPMGFLTYPVSQTADITAFMGTHIPVGDDQLPMLEQARDIVRTFNNCYGETLIEPKAVLPSNESSRRLPGTDGKSKMSKSLNNCIYLADDEKTIHDKVFNMFTDPNHIHASDPGKVEGNIVFVYLDTFCKPEHFSKYLPEYKNLNELKAHYTRGGLGDVKIKSFLNSILQELLKPIREKRNELEKNPEYVYSILKKGTMRAKEVAAETLNKVKTAMGINYEFLK